MKKGRGLHQEEEDHHPVPPQTETVSRIMMGTGMGALGSTRITDHGHSTEAKLEASEAGSRDRCVYSQFREG